MARTFSIFSFPIFTACLRGRPSFCLRSSGLSCFVVGIKCLQSFSCASAVSTSMCSPGLLPLLCCPPDHASLAQRGDSLVCALCGTRYSVHDGDAELLPRAEYAHTTQYLDDTGGQILDYRDFGEPLF